MAKIENLALHVLEQTRNNVNGSITMTLMDIERHKIALAALEDQLKDQVKEQGNLDNAIQKLTGDKNVKTTSKSKKA